MMDPPHACGARSTWTEQWGADCDGRPGIHPPPINDSTYVVMMLRSAKQVGPKAFLSACVNQTFMDIVQVLLIGYSPPPLEATITRLYGFNTRL